MQACFPSLCLKFQFAFLVWYPLGLENIFQICQASCIRISDHKSYSWRRALCSLKRKVSQALGQVLPSIIPVHIWGNFVFFSDINPVNWKSRVLPAHFPLYPSASPLQFINDSYHKDFGDILYSGMFININGIMWDAIQVVCLEKACLSPVGAVSMANPRQLEFMKCRDFRERGTRYTLLPANLTLFWYNTVFDLQG